MPSMFAHHVSHYVPLFAGTLMHRIDLVRPAFTHKLSEEVVRLMWIELLWFAHCIPEILHVLLQAQEWLFANLYAWCMYESGR